MEYDLEMDGELFNIVAMHNGNPVQVVMITNNERKAYRMLRKLTSRQRTMAKRQNRKYKMERCEQVYE
jgi:phosphoribosylcarboxyaminoimidazole (NCAIR) mutase